MALGLERTKRVAAGQVEPTFAMAEVVIEEPEGRALPVPPAPVPPPSSQNPVPLPIQPWARPEPTYAPEGAYAERLW